MLIMVFRKMINKKWMTLCLLIGFVLAVAMVSSIPIYTDGSFNDANQGLKTTRYRGFSRRYSNSNLLKL